MSKSTAELTKTDILKDGYSFSGKTALEGLPEDISALREMKNLLSKAKTEWEETFDTISDAITVHDSEFNVIRANKAATKLLGRSFGAILGSKCYESYHGTTCAPGACPSCRVLATGEPGTSEIFEPHLGRHLEIKALPRRDARGGIIGLVHVVRDITDRKKADERIRRAQEHLEEKVIERTRELSMANARLEELDRMKSMFLASTSHELRTPLNAIIGFTGLVLMGLPGSLNEEQKRQLGLVKQSADHLLDLIEDIIDVSRIESGRLSIERRTFDLGALLGEIVETLKVKAAAKGLGLTLEQAGPIAITSDPKRVRQIVMNLVDNAIKFTDIGTVRLRAEAGGSTVKLAVADTGPGIPDEDLVRLFKPFSRLEQHGRNCVEGTGLGLYLCLKLAGILGGGMDVTSSPDRGSVFTLLLPA